jgi:hypothetical protein
MTSHGEAERVDAAALASELGLGSLLTPPGAVQAGVGGQGGEGELAGAEAAKGTPRAAEGRALAVRPVPATAETRPVYTPFEEPLFAPGELIARKQWIGWRKRWNEAKGKFDKLPVCIADNRGTGYLKPEKHVTYDQAVANIGRLRLDGIGFVLLKGDGLIGGDLDRCRDPETGEIVAWAKAIIDFGETYFEVSRSGTGLRFWAQGEIDHATKYDPAGVELYESGRYLTFTGRHIEGTSFDVRPAPKTIAALLAHIEDTKAGGMPTDASPASFGRDPGKDDGAEAFRRHVYSKSFFGQINSAALANLDKWVLKLFPTAEFQPGTKGYRVTSADLGRPELEEDLSITPMGAKDFGVHDMGDEREGKRSAVDLVIEYHEDIGDDPMAAALWLAEQLGIGEDEFDALGDAEGEPASGGARRDPWAELRAGLRWSGSDLVHAEDNSTEWFAPGVAVLLGKGAPAGDPHARRHVTDHHIRGSVTGVNAPPGGGKTVLAVTYMCAIAAERHDLAGLDRIELPGAVAVIAADNEGLREFHLRSAAFMLHHGLKESDFKHPGYIFPEPGPLVEKARDGTWAPSKWIIQQAPILARLRDQHDLALLVVDTLLGVSGGADAAKPVEMQALMDVVKILASELDMAVELVNHITKGAAKNDATSMDAGRGSRPLTAGCRCIVNLTQEGSVVRIHRSKATYRDSPTGADVFEYKSQTVTAGKRDVRLKPDGEVQSSIGVLAPSLTMTIEQRQDEQALGALWAASQGGAQIRRGGLRGPQGGDTAGRIVEDALGLKDGGGWTARMKAERIVERLVRKGLATVTQAKTAKRNTIEILTPACPWEAFQEEEIPR